MSRYDLSGLVVFGGGRDRWDRYVANEVAGGAVLLPADGAPTYLLGRFPLERHDEAGAAHERWVTDYRVGAPAELLVDLLRERGLLAQRIGVVGLTSRSAFSWSGYVPYTMWETVLAGCPGATFVDVSGQFERLTLVKSDEEAGMIRHAAHLGEAACSAFVDAAGDGVPESAVAAAALHAVVSRGGWFHDPVILVRSGQRSFAWGTPEWPWMGGGSRKLAPGDSISAELFSSYGGFETQQQIQVVVGAPSAHLRQLAATVERAYARGLELLRPGVRFSEVADAVRSIITSTGAWNTGPVIQTVSPVIFNDSAFVGASADPALAGLSEPPTEVPRDGDFVLEKGVALALQPNAVLDGDRVSLGGTVIITSSSVDELNHLPARLHVRA